MTLERRLDMLDEFVAIDLETTGLYPVRGDRVIEVGAVRVTGGKLQEEYCSLIFCEKPIPEEVYSVNNISNEMLRGAPEPITVFSELRSFLGNSILVAHHAKFERAFLRREFRRLGWKFSNRVLCSLSLCRERLSELPNYRLETVANHLFGGKEGDQVHRAIEDARLVARVWMDVGER